jgi:hypothetical protein
MEPNTDSIAYDRLFEAAEAVVSLVNEASGSGQEWISIGLADRGPLKGLSAREVDEGVRFLIRLGLIELSEPRT